MRSQILTRNLGTFFGDRVPLPGVIIEWKMPTRKVTIDGVSAFEQQKADLVGTFLKPYQDLKIPF